MCIIIIVKRLDAVICTRGDIITIKDVARKAGVSTATVSYVINGSRNVASDKRQRVLDIIAETGYQPNTVAKSLRTKKTSTIGVLAEDVLAFPTSRIINGISEYVEKTDYRILLGDLRMLDSLYNQYDQVVLQKNKINSELMFLVYGARVDAMIYIGMFDRDISGVIPNINMPVVIAYSTSRDEHTCFVTYENEKISAQIISYLINMGHRRIAVINGLADTAPAQLRLKGVYEAFKEAELVPDSRMIKNGNWERDSGYSCMVELLKSEVVPTAVFAMNDLMAIGAMDAAREAGIRVPEDISIIGFDNREVSEFVYPRLTTAEIDLKGIGFTAAQIAVENLGGKGQYAGERRVIIPSNIVMRETVAPCVGGIIRK